MKTIKITFDEFTKMGIEKLAEKYPEIKKEKYKFMKGYGVEPDGEVYELPDYLEIELTK